MRAAMTLGTGSGRAVTAPRSGGTAYDSGRAVPVSSRVFRLARTAGQPLEMAWRTSLPGSKLSWMTVMAIALWNGPTVHGSGHPVRHVDHEGVPGLESIKGRAQLGPVLAGTGGFHDDLAAVRGGQRVKLRLVVLALGGVPGRSRCGSGCAAGWSGWRGWQRRRSCRASSRKRPGRVASTRRVSGRVPGRCGSWRPVETSVEFDLAQ